MDSVSRFTATVADYVKYRPGYPEELFAFLASKCDRSSNKIQVAELGAGTGIFTRQLASQPFVRRIYAIEPNDSMRNAAEKESPSAGDNVIVYSKGTAESTLLPSHSVDAIVGAQCFHWFDLAKALPEIERIAKPGAKCFAIWNDRVEIGFNVDLERLLHEYSKPYMTLRRPEGTINDLRKRVPDAVEVAFVHRQVLTLEGLIGRMASTSYVAHGVDDKQSFNRALEGAFRRHERDGHIEMPYQTRVVYWQTPFMGNHQKL